MKKIKIIALATMLIVFAGVMVMINSCTKNHIDEGIQKSLIDEESQAITAHILAFKEKCNYYLQNPEFKSGEFKHIEDAVFDIESSMNFTYCYTNIQTSDKILVNDHINIIVTNEDSLSMNDVAVFSDSVKIILRNQVLSTEFDDKKLLVVDLNLEEIVNNNARISITSLIGNANGIIFFGPPADWMYGDNLGKCDDPTILSDAAEQLQYRVQEEQTDNPPPNCYYYFINNSEKNIDVTHNFLFYSLIGQNNPEDNYKDYSVYYATSEVEPYDDDVRCIEAEEMSFYYVYYNQFVDDFEDETNKKLDQIVIYGFAEPYGFNNTHERLRHNLKIIVGKRLLVCNITPPWPQNIVD
jgi:hypothetical protein